MTGLSDPSPTLPGDGARTPLPARVVTYWRVSAALLWTPIILFVAGLTIAASEAGPLSALVLLPIIGFILDVVVVIPKRHALWWYAIGDEQIDLQHGWLVVRRTVVPMTRVQHVQLERGPLADRFRLAELKIYTAAGYVQIPALDRDEGDRIRQQVAELARIADDL